MSRKHFDIDSTIEMSSIQTTDSEKRVVTCFTFMNGTQTKCVRDESLRCKTLHESIEKNEPNSVQEQYEETIVANLPKRQNLASIISNLDSLLRAALVTLAAYALMRAYMGKMLKVAFKAIGVVDDLFGDD